VQSGAYDRVQSGEYVRRGQEPDWRAETDAATEHYTERFKAFMEGMTDATAKATDVAEKLGEWLKR
jgi:hypothetical protein